VLAAPAPVLVPELFAVPVVLLLPVVFIAPELVAVLLPNGALVPLTSAALPVELYPPCPPGKVV